jgi:hypothetical protein
MRSIDLVHRLHRLIAVGVLLGLLAASSHVHPDPGARGSVASAADRAATIAPDRAAHAATSAPTLTADDAHHEHSPAGTIEAEPCVACRNREEVGHAVAAEATRWLPEAIAHHQGDTSPIPCDSTDRRLPGVRAPPPCRA